MNEVSKDLWRLEHIQEALGKIRRFSEGVETFEDFMSRELVKSAIERQLMIIGEATAHLSPSVKALSSKTQWRKITGLRNILAHEYFTVDPVEVWGIVANRVPELIPVINHLINTLKEEK